MRKLALPWSNVWQTQYGADPRGQVRNALWGEQAVAHRDGEQSLPVIQSNLIAGATGRTTT